MFHLCRPLFLGCCWLLFAGVGSLSSQEFQVRPNNVILLSPEASQQLRVTRFGSRFQKDMTRLVTYQSHDPHIATIDPRGRLFPIKDGQTEVLISYRKSVISRVSVKVQGLSLPPPVSFRHQVLPILTKAGCNSGGCHGKAEGQNGFRLSVFGFDPDADYEAIVHQSRGRRLSPGLPSHSLLLRKATSKSPHSGGERIKQDGLWYRRLERWIAEGAQLDPRNDTPILRIEVQPTAASLELNSRQQLAVTAIDSKGNRHCVTPEAEYRTNNDSIAQADNQGLITTGEVPGESAILVRYQGHVAISSITVPRVGIAIDRPAHLDWIDDLVWKKLIHLGIPPSQAAADETFLRRIYLDTIGTLPTPTAITNFLADQSPDKRNRVIDHLLAHDDYASYWALKWADILRVDKAIVSSQGAFGMTRWLRRELKRNTPYNQMVHAILTAKGNTFSESPNAFFQVHNTPEKLGRTVSQVFLGVRLECAQCHQHPFENLKQEDYYAFSGFFTQVGRKKTRTGGEKVFLTVGTPLKHPRTGLEVPTAGLDRIPLKIGEHADGRQILADWMTSPKNRGFARMLVNRLWAHYLGVGLVEPIDDLRPTNPASNEPLLAALADHFIDSNYDIKSLTRLILQSRVYQLDSKPNDLNRADERHYACAPWKPIPAEVLIDGISQATGVAEQYNGVPAGVRALHLWDNRQPSYFFQIFGRPQRVSVCECERGLEPSITQALHLMNSPESIRKIRHRNGLAAKLANSSLSWQEIVEQLYLSTVSRFPNESELALMKEAFSVPNGNRETITQDILWVLLNTKEFVFNH